MRGVDGVERVRALLDRDRLAVAGALAVAASSTAELIDRTDTDERTVLAALAELHTAGLVRSAGGSHELDAPALRELARSLSDVELPMDPVIGYGMTHDERVVLSRFFEGRTLTGLPASRAKRLVVLERLALEFDPGRRYDEREVNEILGAFHPDWSTLRRQLVDEGFLDREPGAGGNRYWRSGGRVPGVG